MPADPDLRNKIEKLAEFVERKGQAMEDTVRQKHGQDPGFSFLFGGEGSEYYSNCVAGRRPDERQVSEMLAARDAAKRARDFPTADRIRDDLRRMDVNIDDKERSW